MSFDYSALPREYARLYLSTETDFADWNQIAKIYRELEGRPVGSRDELERWLRDESEFSSAYSEAYVLRYVRMTSHTNDPELEKAYLHFVENIDPKAKLQSFKLDRKFLNTPARKELPTDCYSVLVRRRENNVALFRQENVELEKEEAKLAQKFQKIAGARTVSYAGEERTLQQMAQYQENVSREVRQETWRLSEDRRFKDREVVDQIYSELVTLRHTIAKNAGFDNYRDYAFRRREKFDYTPEDCFRFHEAVEQYIVPLIRALDKERKKGLGVDPLRPWDLLVDTAGRPSLTPFKSAAELMQHCREIYERLDPDFGRDFRRMVELGLIDPDSRPGKAPGGYCVEFAEIQLPFIFLNLVGRDNDVRTILHESGHAFQTFATRDRNLLFQYRSDNMPLEFAEVASMSMELLGGEHIDGTFYNHEDAARSRREHLETIVRVLAWIATIDAFQHWVYTHPDHASAEREEFWVKLRKRFGGGESWEGYENIQRTYWQRQLHLFTSPFYYIEYGIAQLGALGIWTHYRRNPADAIEAYKRALALGGSKPLPELFKSANLPFDFGLEIIRTYSHELRKELENN